MQYTVFSSGGSPIVTFESEWRFREGEHLFWNGPEGKRSFVVARVTHDLSENHTHGVRLYCTERKVHKKG